MVEAIVRFAVYAAVCLLLFCQGIGIGKDQAKEEAGSRRCASCRYCFPTPQESKDLFLAHERHCINGRGRDIRFHDSMGGTVSAVSLNGICDEFVAREEADHEQRSHC